MKRHLATCIASALMLVGPWSGFAQEKGYPFRLSNFKIEFYGGYAGIKPADFNTIADYEQSYLQFYHVQRYASLGPDYKVTSERTGDSQFRGLTSGVPIGGRIRYQFSPTMSVSIGLQYMSAKRDSKLGMNVTVSGENGSLNDRYDNNGFGLSVKAWIPQFGAHFGWDIFRIFRPEVFIAFGPVFMECRATNNRSLARIEPDGTFSNLIETSEMKGRKTSLSGELGGALCIHAAKFLDFLFEGSYSFRSGDEVTGSGWSQTVGNSSASGESSTSAKWEKTWLLHRYDSETSWGSFAGFVATNAVDWSEFDMISQVKKFGLDLSSFQLKAGFAIRL